MVNLNKKFMLNNPQGSLIQNIQIIYTDWIRHFIVKSKLPGHGTNKRVFVDLGCKDNKKASTGILPSLFYPNQVRNVLHLRLPLLYLESFLHEAIDYSLHETHFDNNTSLVSGSTAHPLPSVAPTQVIVGKLKKKKSAQTLGEQGKSATDQLPTKRKLRLVDEPSDSDENYNIALSSKLQFKGISSNQLYS